MQRVFPINSSIHILCVALLCALVATGCTAPWSPAHETDPFAASRISDDSPPAPPLAAESTAVAPQQVATAKPVAPVNTLTAEQEIALNDRVAEVRATINLDPAAEHKLRTDLRAARVEEWPAVVKQFRSSLAYKQELLARESQQPDVNRTVAQPAQFPVAPIATTTNTTDSAVQQALDKLQNAVVHDQAVQLTSHAEPSPQPVEPKPLPVRGTTVANRATELPATIQQASLEEPTAVDGRVELATAIASLEQEVKTAPGNTAELQDHLRLRMLMLMSGRVDDSLAPIPGASPTEQDYWSKQLFAISTYLDANRVPDTKQRAAGALIHFDAARAKLAELATLQVRNLTFVDSVDGYGLYEPHKNSKFKPGDQVTLYAEVDNYSCESTKDGYRTTLATSYEVVDLQGRRVDGAQFPDVEDLCRNQRRDFHMQYGVALPTRIYAGEYELRLIITDRLSHKIGQASTRFEIVE